MSATSQKKATAAHRRRAAARGLIRVEVQAKSGDVTLIREVARVLRDEPEKSRALREHIAESLSAEDGGDTLMLFGSDLPDDAFDGVFTRPRDADWRPVSL